MPFWRSCSLSFGNILSFLCTIRRQIETYEFQFDGIQSTKSHTHTQWWCIPPSPIALAHGARVAQHQHVVVATEYNGRPQTGSRLDVFDPTMGHGPGMSTVDLCGEKRQILHRLPNTFFSHFVFPKGISFFQVINKVVST